MSYLKGRKTLLNAINSAPRTTYQNIWFSVNWVLVWPYFLRTLSHILPKVTRKFQVSFCELFWWIEGLVCNNSPKSKNCVSTSPYGSSDLTMGSIVYNSTRHSFRHKTINHPIENYINLTGCLEVGWKKSY